MMEFKRLFTRSEAESTFPLVRQIVGDILATAGRVRGLAEDDPEVPRLQDELAAQVRELEEMGCFYKDWNFTIGLVDFPSVIDGETVFLCWRSDEPSLAWYHPVDEGFQGRRPLPAVTADQA
jgi:hypothetical protein